MSEHVTEDQARIVAEHAWNAAHPDDPWDELTEVRRESTVEFVHMQLRHLTPGLLAAGWMPPREVHSAANDLTGLAARVHSDELHEDKHTPAPARDGATMVICDECDVRWPCDKAVPGTFGYVAEVNPIDGFLRSKRAGEAIQRYVAGMLDARRGGDCE